MPVSTRAATGHPARAETAVLVPITEWKRLSNSALPSLKSLLLSDIGRADLKLPLRKLAKRRPAAVL